MIILQLKLYLRKQSFLTIYFMFYTNISDVGLINAIRCISDYDLYFSYSTPLIFLLIDRVNRLLCIKFVG